MADKPRVANSRTVQVFTLIILFSFCVTLVLVYSTSKKLLCGVSIYSTRISDLRKTFNGIQSICDKPIIDEKIRSDVCKSCFSHNFNYIMNNDVMCKLYDDSQEIDLVIFIFTNHHHENERNAIRQTWLTYTNRNRANIRYSFLLGEVPDENLRKLVEEENSIHNDILKEQFADTYFNLTYKTMMAFKYASTKCSHAKFVLKTDDDMWINIPGLLKIINRERMILQTAVGGSCHHTAYPVRDPSSKWYASFQSYPNESYPGYCSGTGYVTSINVARKVFELSTNVPFFHLEDVYVAMCITILGYKLHPIPGFNSGRLLFDPCLYKGDKLITSHGVPAEMLIIIWNTPCIEQYY